MAGWGIYLCAVPAKPASLSRPNPHPRHPLGPLVQLRRERELAVVVLLQRILQRLAALHILQRRRQREGAQTVYSYDLNWAVPLPCPQCFEAGWRCQVLPRTVTYLVRQLLDAVL